MSDSEQSPQMVRITLTGQRSDGTQFEQVYTAKAGDRFEVGEDGYLVCIDKPSATEGGCDMTELEARYLQLVDRLNNSRTRDERHQWFERLNGFIEGVAVCGGNPGRLFTHADGVQATRGIDRPMVGGVWLDWEPQTDIDNPTGTTTDTTPATATGNVQVGDYVLATKYEDGDPADQWCIGFTSEYWPHKKRWMVVDSDGNNFRHNGFRRAEKITADVGAEILRMMQAGACPDSMWTLRDAVQTDIDNPTDTTEGGAA